MKRDGDRRDGKMRPEKRCTEQCGCCPPTPLALAEPLHEPGCLLGSGSRSGGKREAQRVKTHQQSCCPSRVAHLFHEGRGNGSG